MRIFTVEQTSLTLKWTFGRMLPMLPGPSSEAFSKTVKSLHPYGLRPSMITIETPSTRLSDVTMSIVGLLDNRLAIRMTPGEAEFFLDEYLIDDDLKIINILNTIFTSFKDIDSDADQGTAEVRSTSHLRLESGQTAEMLNERFNPSKSIEGLSPDAIIYKISFGDDAKGHSYRVMIANSAKYKDALFVDIAGTYDGLLSPPDFFATVTHEFDLIMKRFGLEEDNSSV